MTQDILDWQMSTPNGRQFVAELLDLCGAGALAGVGNYAQDFYSLGRRAVGEDVQRLIRLSKDGLDKEYLMLKEHQKRMESVNDGC